MSFVGDGDNEEVGFPESERARGTLTTRDDLALAWWSEGTGPQTITVLHGGPGFHHGYLAPDLIPLASRRRLLFYDQRGAGHSGQPADPSGLSFDRFVDDLEDIREAFGLERLTLLGHSWGALLAGLYATTHPDHVERLILVGADPPSRLPLWPTVAPLARLSTEDVSRLRELGASIEEHCHEYWQIMMKAYFGDPAAIGRMRGTICGDVEGLARALADGRIARDSLGDWDLRPALAKVTACALVIHGTEDPDPIEGAREWVRALPDARLVEVEGAGHFPQVEQPETFFAEVEAFLEE